MATSLEELLAGSTGFQKPPRPELPTLRDLQEIRQLANRIEAQGKRLYARYSLGPDADAIVGSSANQFTKQAEVGLAFNPVMAADVAGGIRDYAYILWQKPQTLCWLATGEWVARGTDGDSLLNNWQPVAWVHMRAVVEALCRADGDAVLIRMGEIQGMRRGLAPGFRVGL